MDKQSSNTLLKKKYRQKLEEVNPCVKESQLSMKCLTDKDYEKDSCQEFFDNYNHCKQFWLIIQRERKKRGITPHLPPVFEREQIKNEYKFLLKKKLNKMRESLKT